MAIAENDNRFLGTKSQQGGAQSSSSGNQSYNSNRILGGRSSNSSGYVSIYNKRGAPNSLQRDYDDYLSKFNSAYDYLQSGQGDSATTQTYLQEAMNASNNLRTFANTTDDGISGDVKLRYRDLANSFDKLAPYLQNMAKEQGAVENYNARINADANIKDLKATLAELQNKKGQALSLTAFDTGSGYDYGKERGSVTDLNKAIAETKAAIKEQEAIKQNSYSTDEEREEILGRNNWMSFFRGSNVAKGAENGEEYYLDPVTGQYVYAGTDAKALQSYQDLQRLHEKDANELLNGDYAYGGEKLNRTLSGGFAQTAGGIAGAIETIADYGAQERQKLIDQGGETYYDEFLGEDVSLNNVRQLQAEAEKYQAVAERAQNIYNTMDEQSKSDIAAAKAGLGKFGQFAVDLGVNAVQMGTDMVFGAGTSTLLPMAVRVFGQEAQAAKAQGYDVYKQLGYGVTKAGIEMATEKIFGMFDKIGYGKGVVSGDWEKDLVEKLAGDKLGRFAARFVLAGLEEGGEEVLSELFSPLADAILTGKVDFSTIDPAETLYSFLIGAAMGSIGTVGGVVTGQNADADAQIDQRATNRMLPKLSDENAKLNKSESKMRDLFNRSRDALAAIESGQTVPDSAQLSRSELIRAVDAGIVTVTEANIILQNETVAAQQATEIASDMSPEDLKEYEAEHGKKAAKAAEKRAQKQADFLTRADENQFGTEQASFEQTEAEELAKQQAEQTPQNLQNKAPQTQDVEKGTQTPAEQETAVDTPSRELNSEERTSTEDAEEVRKELDKYGATLPNGLNHEAVYDFFIKKGFSEVDARDLAEVYANEYEDEGGDKHEGWFDNFLEGVMENPLTDNDVDSRLATISNEDRTSFAKEVVETATQLAIAKKHANGGDANGEVTQTELEETLYELFMKKGEINWGQYKDALAYAFGSERANELEPNLGPSPVQKGGIEDENKQGISGRSKKSPERKQKTSSKGMARLDEGRVFLEGRRFFGLGENEEETRRKLSSGEDISEAQKNYEKWSAVVRREMYEKGYKVVPMSKRPGYVKSLSSITEKFGLGPITIVDTTGKTSPDSFGFVTKNLGSGMFIYTDSFTSESSVIETAAHESVHQFFIKNNIKGLSRLRLLKKITRNCISQENLDFLFHQEGISYAELYENPPENWKDMSADERVGWIDSLPQKRFNKFRSSIAEEIISELFGDPESYADDFDDVNAAHEACIKALADAGVVDADFYDYITEHLDAVKEIADSKKGSEKMRAKPESSNEPVDNSGGQGNTETAEEKPAVTDKGSFANLEITKHENLSTDTRTVATVSTKAAENGKISEKPVADAHAEIAMTKDIVLDENSNADSWRNALIKEIGDNIEATGGKVKANALNGAEVLINTEGAQAKTLFRTVFTEYDIDGRPGKSFEYNETILAAETQFPTVLEKGQLVDLPSINEDGETKWGNPEKFAIAGYVEVGSGDKVLVCCQIAAKQTATGTEYTLVRVVDGESCAVLNFKPAESESSAPVQAKTETKESANAEAKKNLEDRSRKSEKARLLSSDTKWTLSDIVEAQMITEYDRLKLNHDMASGNMTTTEFNLRMDEIKRLENRVKSETELFGEEAKNVYEKSNGALVLENAAKSLLSFSGDTKARPDSNRAKIYLRIENAVRSLDSAVEAGDIDGIIRSIKQSNKARGLDKAVPFGLGEKFQNNMLKDLKANGLTADDFARMAYGSIYGITSDFVNTSFLDKVRTVRILNALSNPATAVNNVANNEVTGTVNAIGHNVGYFLDRALGNQFEKITGKAAIGKDYSVGIWNRKFGKNNERRAELLAWEYSVMASMSGVSPDSSRIDVSGVSAFDPNGNLIERALSLYSFMINATVLAPDAMSKARAEIGLQKGIDEKISKMFKDEDLQKTLDGIRGEEASKLESEIAQIHDEYESGRNPPKSGSMSERAAELLRIERSEGRTAGRINSNEKGRAKRYSQAKENAAISDAKAASEERIQKRIEKAEADWNARKEASRAELEEDMRNEKLRRTYQDDNKISNAVVKARNAVDEWSMSWTGGKVRLGSFGVLFAKVPTNVVKMAAEGTPLYAAVAIGQYAGMIHKAQQMHDAVVRGDPGAQEMSSAEAAKAIRNLGRAATHGIGMTVLGFVAAMTGALKYFDPDDDSEEAKRAKEKGMSGLQLNFGAMVHGGEWDWDKDWVVGGDWLEIIAPAMTIGASIAEARKDSMSFPETIAFAAGNSFSNMLSLAENIPGLQQAAELYNGYANASVSEDENNRNWKKMMNAGSQYMASSLALYALPNATQNLAAGMDNTVRDIYNTDTATQKMWNIIKSKEIFLRKTIPEKLDSFGKTRAYGETKALGVVNKLLLPGDVRILSTSATEKELNRLVNEGYSGVYPKTTVPRKFTANGQDYVMNADQRRDYQQKLAITYTQYMEDAMNTSWYKDAPDSYKAKALNQLRLTAERETKNYLLQSMGALDDKSQPAKIKLDKWEETLTTTSDRVQYLMSKQEVSELYDDNVLQSYADMDSYLKDNYSKLTPDQKTLLNNSYSFLDDMYDASKHGINSEQWTQAHDIYKKYAEDKDKKKNQMNTAAMWAEFSKIPGMSGSKLSYVEDNMRLYNMAPVNVDKLNELNSIGLNPDKVTGVSKAIFELPVLEGHSGVLNNQKYEAIAKLSGYSDEEKWKIFLTYATDAAIRDVRAKWNQREARGWSFAQCLHEAKRDVYK